MSLSDLTKVETTFAEGNNSIRIVTKPSAGKYFASKLPEGMLERYLLFSLIQRWIFLGFEFIWHKSNCDESRFLIQLTDDIDENMRVAIEVAFTGDGAMNTGDSILDHDACDTIIIQDSPEQQCESQVKERSRSADMNDCEVPEKQLKIDDYNPPVEIRRDVFDDEDFPQPIPIRTLRSRTRNAPENNPSPYVVDNEALIAEEENHASTEESKPKKKDKKKAPSRNPDFDRFDDLQQLLVFDDVEIRMEDWKCLDRREMLTGPIINFYLKFIYNLMSEELRERVHIYSTNFYTMYSVDTSYAGWNEEGNLNAAEKRYNRVQGLPCNTDVNIFDKDFIVFPCHDNQHWFLSIACFPKLSGAVTVNGNQPVEDNQKRYRDMKNPDVGEPIKSSVILTFDSVTGNGGRRTKALKYIRQFLLSEYNAKYKNDFPFVSNDVISSSVHVSHFNVRRDDPYNRFSFQSPQQKNTVDCGLFLLENMEQFFIKEPINDFRTPMKRTDWFNPDTVGEKREEIANTLKALMLERGELPELPILSFHEFAEELQLIDENCSENPMEDE